MNAVYVYALLVILGNITALNLSGLVIRLYLFFRLCGDEMKDN